MNAKVLFLVTMLFFMSCSPKNSSEGLNVYPKAVEAADEGFAIQSLKMIATAQTQAKVMRGSYADFKTLNEAGLLDERFAASAPVLKGYQFTMTENEAEFVVHADPQKPPLDQARARHLYLDSSDGSIHVNTVQTATKTDPVL